MQKVGIITFTDGDNYGQRLQNLAVQELIREFGFEPYTIRQDKSLRKRLRFAKKKMKDFLSGMWYVKRKRHSIFLKFDKDFICYYTHSISEKCMNKFPEQDFSFFLVGSDQVWSPYSGDVNATMFLQFTDVAKRIPIAPSMACEDIPFDWRETYKRYLSDFKYLSVRETRGAELIHELVGKKAEVLIDPTLMFNGVFWEKYERKPVWLKKSDYMLCYFLGDGETKDSITELNGKYNYTVINLLKDDRCIASGPSEFIYLIHHAKVVITDSYHGSIFSLLYGVPLVIKTRKGNSVQMTSRFDTLIEKFHLKLLEDGTVVGSDFYTLIDVEREKEINYLKEAFHNAEVWNGDPNRDGKAVKVHSFAAKMGGVQ